jgi:hypothetical protein
VLAVKCFGLVCLLAWLGGAACAAAQTPAPLPHWAQLDGAHRKSVKSLLSEGYELKAAFTNSYEQEIAYLQKGGSLFRCVIGGANLGLLADNELLCAEFIDPYRAN